MVDETKFSPVSRGFIVAASIIIVAAGIKLANSFLAPIVFAGFLAIIAAPVLRWLRNRGFSFLISVLIMILFVIVLGIAITLFLYVNFNLLQTKLPEYQKQLGSLIASINSSIESGGIDPSSVANLSIFQPATIAKVAGFLVLSLISSLSSAFLVFLLLLFMLAAAPALSKKVRTGKSIPDSLLNEGSKFARDVRSYMWVSTLDNVFVAALFTPFLLLLGVDFALLWGFLALILSYIPTIGLVLAAAPAVIIALLTQGPIIALVVVIGAVVINFIGDNIFTPRVAAKALSLTPLTIILSFIIWAYLFGLLGGLFSVPLTLAVKTVLGSYPQTRWIADVMVLEEEETPSAGAPREAA